MSTMLRAKLEAELAEAAEENERLRAQLEAVTRERDERYDCRGGPGATTPACGGCVTCLHRVIEAVTRERDAKEREIQRLLNVVCDSPACTAAVVRRDDGSRVCAAGHAARWVNVDLLRAVERERDEARAPCHGLGCGHCADCVSLARADAVRLREALTQVRDAMLATGQGPDGDDDPRRPLATAVWSALASTPAPGPTRAEAEAWVGDGEAASGMLAHSAESAPGPTEREMRVAEAVVEAFRTKVVATTAWLAGTRHCLSVAERLDLRTIAAKAVEP